MTFDKISVVLPIKSYEEDIKIINAIIRKVKKYQKTKISTIDEFMGSKIDMMIWILEKTKNFINQNTLFNFFTVYICY